VRIMTALLIAPLLPYLIPGLTALFPSKGVSPRAGA
jgi:hypothetical protein